MALFTAIGIGLGAAAGLTGTALLTAGGVGMMAGSQYYAAQGQKSQAAFNRDVALNNQIIAEQNVADIADRGRVAVYDQRRAVARELGNVRAATAGSGLVVDEAGTTPQDMVRAMVDAGELDVMRLQNNIDREQRRASIQGANFAAQAGQFEANRASINPFRSALTSAFQGATTGMNADILFGS